MAQPMKVAVSVVFGGWRTPGGALQSASEAAAGVSDPPKILGAEGCLLSLDLVGGSPGRALDT